MPALSFLFVEPAFEETSEDMTTSYKDVFLHWENGVTGGMLLRDTHRLSNIFSRRSATLGI